MEKITESNLLRDNIMLMIGSGAVLYYIFQSLIVIRSLRPLDHMRNELVAISRGDGDLVSRLDVRRKDEIGQTAEAFNSLLDSFRTMVLNIQESASQVSASTDQLYTGSSEVRGASRQTSAIMEELAEGAERQLAVTESSMTHVKNMTAGVRQINMAALETAELSQGTHQLSFQGEQALTRTLQQMEQIQATTEQSAEAVRDLESKTAQIGMMGKPSLILLRVQVFWH
ncbi:methyl-accepting chemotaxis protein [Paenibacillus lemnae]|uniref:Methyl-accepting chemotaxis protein n=1 Tax=Paenibacillus lemnae TaxID=1330551 RepID=A0A848M8I9_PAELE|nr:methyl-accepting chemotaxis protein [Paenibacillus lemnae]NMO96510.1 methyl-accepting chemotaxis protein [Paenibacillus lemnae]